MSPIPPLLPLPSPSKSISQIQSRYQPWADLSPGMLNMIYVKHPPGPAGDIEFQFVCKNWCQIDHHEPKFEQPPTSMIPRPSSRLKFSHDEAPERSTIDGAWVIHRLASGWCLLASCQGT
ncbi:unnamed protein product [Linum trigynum]|uniref:Uncharacterized protein n=1 Tax=Linum trigynum TaxID=586398 RepID=A0AAV2CTM8_9ROSI